VLDLSPPDMKLLKHENPEESNTFVLFCILLRISEAGISTSINRTRSPLTRSSVSPSTTRLTRSRQGWAWIDRARKRIAAQTMNPLGYVFMIGGRPHTGGSALGGRDRTSPRRLCVGLANSPANNRRRIYSGSSVKHTACFSVVAYRPSTGYNLVFLLLQEIWGFCSS